MIYIITGYKVTHPKGKVHKTAEKRIGILTELDPLDGPKTRMLARKADCNCLRVNTWPAGEWIFSSLFES